LLQMSWTSNVPLSWQAVAITRELQPFTGNGRYLVHSLRTNERPNTT
jgi:hypothetical protein